jgi:hypothetical protein
MELALGILWVLMWVALVGVIVTVPLFVITLTYSWVTDLRTERMTVTQDAPAHHLAPASRLTA